MAADLLDGQGVHIGAQPDGPIAAALFENADNASPFMHLETKLAQKFCDLGFGALFSKAQFRMAMKITSKCRQFLMKLIHARPLHPPEQIR